MFDVRPLSAMCASGTRAGQPAEGNRRLSAQINREIFRQPPRRLNYRAPIREGHPTKLQGHSVMPTKRQTFDVSASDVNELQKGVTLRVRAGSR